jgi:hypothetical protein
MEFQVIDALLRKKSVTRQIRQLVVEFHTTRSAKPHLRGVEAMVIQDNADWVRAVRGLRDSGFHLWHANRQTYFAAHLAYTPSHAGVLVEYTFLRSPDASPPPLPPPPPPPPPPARVSTPRGREGGIERENVSADREEAQEQEEQEQEETLQVLWEADTMDVGQPEQFLTCWIPAAKEAYGERQLALERALEIGHLLGRNVVLPPWAWLDILFHRPSPGNISALVPLPDAFKTALAPRSAPAAGLHGSAREGAEGETGLRKTEVELVLANGVRMPALVDVLE